MYFQFNACFVKACLRVLGQSFSRAGEWSVVGWGKQPQNLGEIFTELGQ